MENKILSYSKMRKVTNSKKQVARRALLAMHEFSSLKEAKKALGMQHEKADDVYEQLMTNYNEQIDVIRKQQRRAKYQEAKEIQQDVTKVLTFNKDGNAITLRNMTPKKLIRILESLDLTQRVVLEIDEKFITLSHDKVNKMLKDIEQFWVHEVEDYGSNYNADIILQIKEVREITLQRPKWKGKNTKEGAFFKYYHLTTLDLGRFGVHSEKQEKYNENCFVQSLITLGIDDEIVRGIRSIICSKYLPTNKLSQIAEKFKLYFRIKTLDKKKDTYNFGNKSHREVLLGLIDQHYFAIAPVQITTYALKNYFELNTLENYNQIIDKTHKKKKDRFTNSWEVIKYMHANKDTYLREIPLDDLLDTQYYNEAPSKIVDLNYNHNSIKENLVKPKKDINASLVFFDFETITDEIIHTPYMVCNSETKIQYGDGCGYYMLRDLYEKFHKQHNTLILIAHNAGYDFRFLQPYLILDSMIERGHNVLEVKSRFYYAKGRYMTVILKDSYSIITMPLRKFGECFQLDQEKEIIPYYLYTRHNIEKKLVPISECKAYCDRQVRSNILDRLVTTKDYTDFFKSFLDNCSKWGCIEDDRVDIIKYSKIYCEKDVEVLQKGYTKFGEMLQESCNMDIKHFMSSAQLAHQYMLEKNVFEGVNQLSSTPREYIMKCMVGGRTMCAENKMHHVIAVLDDFDAVSLYPSAMHRLGGYLKGAPKVLENKSYTFLQKQDGYFVQIKVNHVGKSRKFPLMSFVNKDGVRTFTNTPIDNLYVCKFDLEDLIKFHQIEFEIIDGYYYNEGRNEELKDVIDFVFNERLKLKHQENPLQEIYKLIMNSSYGKTLQKAIAEEIKFVSGRDLDNTIDKHYNRIIHYEGVTKLHNEDDSFKKYKVKMEKGINDHFNNCHCGVEVLAMSKRIMNEVMCLAEDKGLTIYYQDTDSMHIKHDDIATLAEHYKQEYNRTLIGESMGQFHTDFKSKLLKGQIHAVESIFLGKKCYIDKLKGDEEGVYDYHIRMKGVPNGSITHKAKTENRSVMDIYKSLLKGKAETFDICCGGDKISFDYHSNYTISTKFKFERELKFRNLEGQFEKTENTCQHSVSQEHALVNHHIYKWSSKDCNMIYVGRTKDFKKRRDGHIKACNKPDHRHHNTLLYKTIREHGGTDNWNMEVIDSFYAQDKRQAEQREQEWKDKLDASLNMLNPVRKQKAKEFVINP